jgi:Tfp pilus assembly protein PilP
MKRPAFGLMLFWAVAFTPEGTLRADPPAAPAPGAAAAPSPAPALTGPEAAKQRMSILRRKVLRDEDFAENDEGNRDPFRSYVGIFVDRPARPGNQVIPSVFSKFALEELTLIAIISGDANPRAMFRDPSGLGQTVKRGDYVSKSAARVAKILSDRVILELAEITSGGETRALEKAVLVDPEGANK